MDTEVAQDPDTVNNNLKKIGKNDLNGKIENVQEEEKDNSDHDQEINENDDGDEEEEEEQVYANGGGGGINDDAVMQESNDKLENLDENDQLRQELEEKKQLISQYEAQINKLQVSLNEYKNNMNNNKYVEDQDDDDDDVDDNKLDTDNDNVVGYSNDYFRLYQEKVMETDKHREELNRFKSAIISRLRYINDDCDKREAKLRSYQNKLNIVTQEKRKLQRDKDKLIKQKENENKQLRAKNNEARAEVTRIKQSVEKVERDANLEKDQIRKKIDKLENDKKALQEKLKIQIKKVEDERKEKMKVKDDNQDALRNATQEIARQLQREKENSLSLVARFNTLEEENKSLSSQKNQYISKLKSSEEREKRQKREADHASKQKQDALNQLNIARTKLKNQQNTFDEANREVTRLRVENENQKRTIAQLNDSVKKKSEKEKQFDDIRKRLQNRERKLEEREKTLKNREKSLKSSKRSSSSSGKPTRVRIKEQIESKDPLHRYRNMLPFHWISLMLVIILMMAIAQKR